MICEIDELYICMCEIVLNMSNTIKIIECNEGKNKLREKIQTICLSDEKANYIISKMEHECGIMKHLAENVIEWLDIHEDKEVVDDMKINEHLSEIIKHPLCKQIIQKCQNDIRM